ncbi:small heat shock protein [Ligilactobacillus salitolerans]|uniref:Small heat shock protein n=1 Tax=Ligilactobacillus salitolerans TaxID=1808352 RepID=A0A401IQA3_9LACO|nr:Hsp20/alpha crystallin family protein [Ligilactobacillus salitolerans]GBG93711.1 small heat shock protein [Ligilactobacillus salitolerans]
MANDISNRFNDLANSGEEFFKNFGRPFLNFSDSFKELRSDVNETDTDYTVAIDVPGVDKKDISIDFKDNTLTVSAKRESFADRSDKEGNLIANERSYGRFTRQYNFPDVDHEKIGAKYEDGVLTVTLPKTSAGQSNTHRIEID